MTDFSIPDKNANDQNIYVLLIVLKEPFLIFKLTTDSAKKISATPDELHKHDYEELIICTKGKLDHFIDFKNTTIEAPVVSFVTKGKIHRVIPALIKGGHESWVMRFSSEFISETTFHLYSYYHDHANIKINTGPSFARMTILCEMMFSEAQQPAPDYAVIRHLLSALFIMVESERKKTETNEKGQSTQNITFKNFLKILEENYHRHEGVDFYAEKLFMSARNLNLICQNTLHKSVSEIIETRKLIEAKSLLISTSKTVSEIGFELGYQEKAYFTNVFKKKSGQTPSEFREEMRKIVS